MNDSSLDNKVKVKSLSKSLQLLSLFDLEHPERGITELAELTGMLKSSVSNIVSTFEAHGVLRKNPSTGKYQLGSRVLSYANAYFATNTFDVIMTPYIDELAETLGETTYLAVPDQGRVVYISSAVPKAQAGTHRYIRGVTADMHCTGIGKAMLAYLPAAEQSRIVSGPLAPYTPNTITSPDKLMRELDVIRHRGYSIDNMEHEYGIKCVAAPLFNAHSELIGAISVSGPSLRFTSDKIMEYAAALMSVAKKVQPQLF